MKSIEERLNNWRSDSQFCDRDPKTEQKTLRVAAGFTRPELAAYLQVSYQAVYNWDRGIYPMPYAVFRLLDLHCQARRSLARKKREKEEHQANDGRRKPQRHTEHPPA